MSAEVCGACGTAEPCANGCADMAGIDVLHMRTVDGRCVISLSGQGHLPCSEHPALAAEEAATRQARDEHEAEKDADWWGGESRG